MKTKFDNIRHFFNLFFCNEYGEFGDTYPEIVQSAVNILGGVDEQLITEIDLFLQLYSDDESAMAALRNVMGDDDYWVAFPPTLTVFLSWLSSYLKELAQQ